MTQIAFADLLGISKQQLYDIERNRKYVSPKLAAEYAAKKAPCNWLAFSGYLI